MIINKQLLDQQIEWLASQQECDERDGLLQLLASIDYALEQDGFVDFETIGDAK